MKIYKFISCGAKRSFINSLMLLVFASLFLLAPSFSWAAPSTDSMLGYWKFDGNGADSSGDGNTATILNGATFSPTHTITSFPNTESIYFPSLSSYVEVANQPGVSPTSSLTFSMWVNANNLAATGTQTIGGNYNQTDVAQGYYFSFDSTNFYFHLGSSGVAHFPIAANLTTGSWFHVVGTWDGTLMNIYLNGSLMGTYPSAIAPAYNSTVFRVGNILGSIDDVRLYSRALSSTEVYQLYSGNHTSANWTGDLGIDYGVPRNWNIEAVPDPYTIVNIPNVINKPEFSQSEGVAGLNILTGGSLNIRGYNFKISDSGLFSNGGNFILENNTNQVIGGLVNDIDSGNIIVVGGTSGGELKLGSQYYDLTMSETGYVSSLPATLAVYGNLTLNSGNFNLQGSLNVFGDIISTGGLLNANSNNINLNGNWNGLTTSFFVPGSSTVNLLGLNQSISGNNNFYNLYSSSSTSKTITFESGSTQVIGGSLYLHGQSGSLTSLRSSTSGIGWRINPMGLVDINYLDVMDSNNISTTSIDATSGNIIDSGNNINWVFDVLPPNIALNTVVANTNDLFYPVTGTVSDGNNVLAVHFKVDTGTWSSCVADDGSFNETAENFTCTPGQALTEGMHTIYIKAIDQYSNITAAGSYSTVVFAVNISFPQIILNTSNYNTSNPLFSVSGNATDGNKISSVEFEIDSDNSWTACSPNDGNFDGTTEGFTCAPNANLIDGIHTYRLRSTDSLSNVTTVSNYTSFSFNLDTVIPTVSNESSLPDVGSVVINWLTNESASSKVEYGVGSAYGEVTAEQDLNTPVQSHSVSIFGLSSCTTYHYRVISRDLALNQIIGVDQIFTTGGCGVIPNTGTTSSISSSSSCSKDKPGDSEITSIDVNGEDSITLNIDEASGDDDEYDIKYGTSSDNYEWSVEDIDKDEISSYEIGELDAGTTYYFKVRAKNECEKGDWSDYESAKTDYKIVSTSPASSLSQTSDVSLAKTESITSAPIPADDLANESENGADFEKNDYLNTSQLTNGNDSNSKNKLDRKKDAKESEAPISEEYSASLVEVLDDAYGRKRLKVSGFGPPNTDLKVYVYSDNPIVLSVKTDKDGNWSYVLENDLEDGEHQIYVALTEEGGDIKGKSNPLVFVKTAQAVTIISDQPISPMEKAKKRFFVFSIVISAIAILLALLIIGWKMKTQKSDEKVFGEHKY